MGIPTKCTSFLVCRWVSAVRCILNVSMGPVPAMSVVWEAVSLVVLLVLEALDQITTTGVISSVGLIISGVWSVSVIPSRGVSIWASSVAVFRLFSSFLIGN